MRMPPWMRDGRTTTAATLMAMALAAGPAAAQSGAPAAKATAAPTAAGPLQTPTTQADKIQAQVQTLHSELENPWGVVQLPDGQLLVTQKAGQLLRLSADGKTKTPIGGVPKVNASGQGGLLGIALDPDFATTPWVYLSYSEPGSDAESGLAGTSVVRGKLSGQQLTEVQVIFRQQPKVSGGGHYGSRLVFGRDKTLFITTGERMKGAPSQDLMQTLGKVIRVQRDGTIPAGNPTFESPARPGIWSYGHRNIQGAALHPETGELWLTEHGPQGGDEVNIARAGQNYGWPARSYGCQYGDAISDRCRLGGGTHAPQFIEPLTTWVPISIAPSGLVFYTGSMFPEWRGQLISGSLAGQALWRMTLEGNRIASRESMLASLGERFRDLTQASDGALLAVTDGGKLLRIHR